MANADIRVTFDGTPPGSIPRYLPGANVSGIVRVTAIGGAKCNHLWVKLKWQTEGRGDRDENVLHTIDVHQGELPGGVAREFPFRFELPRDPWSYAGHYINIVWGIEVDVDVPWSGNPRAFAPFAMAPAWAG